MVSLIENLYIGERKISSGLAIDSHLVEPSGGCA
jgi:hypothetical protein